MAAYIDDTMTLEQKLAAIDEAMQQLAAIDEAMQQAASTDAPVDPAELVMCEGCQ